jgi:multiple antibiotic resistance protein
MSDAGTSFVGAVMFALATLLPIVNPPGVAPIFLAMTRDVPDAIRTVLAARIARNSCVLLLVAMIAGSYVLMFFGLSLAVIRIAGGLLVIATAWHLIRAEEFPDPAIVGAPSATSLDPAGSRSLYPLTFPVTVGPGSISVAVTLGAGVRLDAPRSPAAVLGSVAAIVVVSLTVYLCYRFASRLVRVLGGNGTVVLLRFSAFILLAVGIQILCDGLVERFIAPTSP